MLCLPPPLEAVPTCPPQSSSPLSCAGVIPLSPVHPTSRTFFSSPHIDRISSPPSPLSLSSFPLELLTSLHPSRVRMFSSIDNLMEHNNLGDIVGSVENDDVDVSSSVPLAGVDRLVDVCTSRSVCNTSGTLSPSSGVGSSLSSSTSPLNFRFPLLSNSNTNNISPSSSSQQHRPSSSANNSRRHSCHNQNFSSFSATEPNNTAIVTTEDNITLPPSSQPQPVVLLPTPPQPAQQPQLASLGQFFPGDFNSVQAAAFAQGAPISMRPWNNQNGYNDTNSINNAPQQGQQIRTENNNENAMNICPQQMGCNNCQCYIANQFGAYNPLIPPPMPRPMYLPMIPPLPNLYYHYNFPYPMFLPPPFPQLVYYYGTGHNGMESQNPVYYQPPQQEYALAQQNRAEDENAMPLEQQQPPEQLNRAIYNQYHHENIEQQIDNQDVEVEQQNSIEEQEEKEEENYDGYDNGHNFYPPHNYMSNQNPIGNEEQVHGTYENEIHADTEIQDDANKLAEQESLEMVSSETKTLENASSEWDDVNFTISQINSNLDEYIRMTRQESSTTSLSQSRLADRLIQIEESDRIPQSSDESEINIIETIASPEETEEETQMRQLIESTRHLFPAENQDEEFVPQQLETRLHIETTNLEVSNGDDQTCDQGDASTSFLM